MTDPQLPPPSYNPAPASVPPVPSAPGYQEPASGYQTPPGAYAAPVGGYSSPAGNYQAPTTSEPKSPLLGAVAFVLAIVAAVVTPIIAGFAGYQVGFGLPSIMQYIDSSTSDLSFLSPVRDQVLLGEIGFWVGTLAGIAAIVLGIMAIAKRQGRGWGITALILGAVAPVIFFIVLSVTLGIGAGAGAVALHGS